MVAGFGSVAVDELRRAHAALALELNFYQLQRRVGPFVFIVAAADEQARLLNRDFTRCYLNRTLHGLSTVHLQRFTLKDRECPGPRLKAAQAVEQ